MRRVPNDIFGRLHADDVLYTACVRALGASAIFCALASLQQSVAQSGARLHSAGRAGGARTLTCGGWLLLLPQVFQSLSRSHAPARALIACSISIVAPPRLHPFRHATLAHQDTYRLTFPHIRQLVSVCVCPPYTLLTTAPKWSPPL